MLGEDLYFLILETLRRLTISVYEFGAGMGVDGCSSCGSLDRDGVGVSSSFGRDMGAGGTLGGLFICGTLKSLLICICRNHGIGSRMSICPVCVDVVHCVTGLDGDLSTVVSVGISLDITVSGVVELTVDSGSAIMSVGDSVGMTGSEVMQLGDSSLSDGRSATVSVGITVGTEMVSLMGSSTSMLRGSVGSWGRGLSRLHCANVTL